MRVTVADDGVTEYTFRQSTTKDMLLCMERAREKIHGLVVDEPTDASVTGTALHTYIEHRLEGWMPSEAMGAALQQLHWELQTARMVKTKRASTCEAYVVAMANAWERDISHKLLPMESLEHTFRAVLDTDPATERRLVLEGTWDARDIGGGLHDWKTASRLDDYEQWQVDRWAIQPTFYGAAAAILDGWDDPTVTPLEYDFSFHVMTKTRRSTGTTIDTVRTASDFAWLRTQLWAFADFWDRNHDAPSWPRNDQHALCSMKWCATWRAGRCKGALVAAP